MVRNTLGVQNATKACRTCSAFCRNQIIALRLSILTRLKCRTMDVPGHPKTFGDYDFSEMRDPNIGTRVDLRSQAREHARKIVEAMSGNLGKADVAWERAGHKIVVDPSDGCAA